MLTLLKNQRRWVEMNILMEKRLEGTLFKRAAEFPDKYPCWAFGYITNGVNGFEIRYVYLYKEHAERLLKNLK